MRVLVDDRRIFTEPRGDDVVCRDEIEGMLAIETMTTLGQTIDELWLDGDLGMHPKRGLISTRPLVNFLDEHRDEYLPVIERIFVHSANPAAVAYMVPGLKQAGYDVSARSADGYELIDGGIDW